ncbi:hypothetical protein L596_004306 [Steinernema carpocapsae]|uniref:Uncharacterized protein n=1 Tax=Steinernema carpocapsae TaxID=34508 RepID=A0A4U8UVI7_STECR|nr:hypothetical protein L596_004306 [Steinernema carpocapsae]
MTDRLVGNIVLNWADGCRGLRGGTHEQLPQPPTREMISRPSGTLGDKSVVPKHERHCCQTCRARTSAFRSPRGSHAGAQLLLGWNPGPARSDDVPAQLEERPSRYPEGRPRIYVLHGHDRPRQPFPQKPFGCRVAPLVGGQHPRQQHQRGNQRWSTSDGLRLARSPAAD